VPGAGVPAVVDSGGTPTSWENRQHKGIVPKSSALGSNEQSDEQSLKHSHGWVPPWLPAELAWRSPEWTGVHVLSSNRQQGRACCWGEALVVVAVGALVASWLQG
jgi:hypothetical protein